MKKVLYIVIDALTSDVFQAALSQGRLPHLAQLVAAGDLRLDCTSIFPSITPAATASLITGEYPAQHGIMGAYFYDAQAERVQYYGDDIWPVMTRGLGRHFREFLLALNDHRLTSPTLFERAEHAGHPSASLNFLVYRGPHAHDLRVPLALRLVPGVPARATVHGPTHLALGDFASPFPGRWRDRVAAEGGPLHRFGFADRTTARLLLAFVHSGTLPPLTVAYFPEYDARSHQVGPVRAVAVLEDIDAWIGELFEACGGVDAMLRTLCVLITGDHSQSHVADDAAEATIALADRLAPFELVPAGEDFTDGDQLMACPNLRAAQFYLPQRRLERLQPLVERLLAIEQVDQVIWAEDAGPQRTLCVATADRGVLRCRAGEGGEHLVVDAYGTQWSLTGDFAALDLDVRDGRLQYGAYPNALERIAGAFGARTHGAVWATARPGAEFALPGTSVHAGGGSHGSLHRLDSTSPLLGAGLPDPLRLPAHPRTIDLAPLCLSVLSREGA